MADHAKATEHHGKAGAALKAGDFKAAAHHMGHALAACRQHGHAPPKGATSHVAKAVPTLDTRTESGPRATFAKLRK